MVAIVAPGAGPAMAMTLTEYAKRRRCSLKSVSLAASSGRLVASVGRSPSGRAVSILDPELADREWEVNTRRRADRPGPDVAIVDKLIAAAQDRPPTGPHPQPEIMDLRDPRAVPPYNTSRDLRAAADARNAILRADLAELELAEKRGRLVDAEQARADVFARISMAKTRLLGVPTLVAQDAPDLAQRIVPLIERRVREALEELSGA